MRQSQIGIRNYTCGGKAIFALWGEGQNETNFDNAQCGQSI
mgnify:CR=1 FL=1